jgi:ABC-type glycerol-3-phosphate transport system permease component
VALALGKRATERITKTGATLIVALGAAMVLFPIMWMLSTSLKAAGDVFLIPIRWIPNPLRWSNYPEALKFMKAGVLYRNTFFVCFMCVVGGTLSSAITAYPFARLRAPGAEVLFFLVISTMMLPPQVTLIPQFLIMKWLGWVDDLKSLWVPFFFGAPFHVFLLRQFFRSINGEIDDAAIIDGCNHYSVFWFIILPLSKPALGVVAIQIFMAQWNNFLRPLIFLNSSKNFTVAIGLRQFQVAYGGTPWHLFMAASLVALLPTIAMFFVAQRYFIQGIVISGVKG